MSTIWFRAASRLGYARALIRLTELARERPELDFTYGPLHLEALEEQGLAVSGPGTRSWADDFMAEVPGLHRADE